MAPGNNRILLLAAAVGSLTLLAVAIFMLWPADPSDTAGPDQADGETIGWVSKVEANTIHVNSGPFGGGVVQLLVTKNTKITVGSKEGWFEDIRPGGKRLARTVEVLVDEGPRRPVRAEPRVKSAAGSAATEPVPTKALPGNPPTSEPRAALGVHPTTPPVAAAPPPPKPALPEVRPATRAEPTRAQVTEPTPPRTSSTGGRVTAPTENGGRTPDAARPQPVIQPAVETGRSVDGESTDGAAAVDWLLKGRR